MSNKIALRSASANDNSFLIQVYASTRQEELSYLGWTPAQQAAFIQMQFDIRQRGYAATYPSAETTVISIDDVSAGSMIIFRGKTEIRLVDISLLPEFRGSGIGAELIHNLITEAISSKRPLRLSVLRNNRAAHLYERLGLVTTGSDAMYCEMEYTPKQAQNAG